MLRWLFGVTMLYKIYINNACHYLWMLGHLFWVFYICVCASISYAASHCAWTTESPRFNSRQDILELYIIRTQFGQTLSWIYFSFFHLFMQWGYVYQLYFRHLVYLYSNKQNRHFLKCVETYYILMGKKNQTIGSRHDKW